MSDIYTLRLSNPKRDLEQIPVYLVDNSERSLNYFTLSDVPDELCSGKNIFKIAGNVNSFVPNSEIQIEVKDASGNVLYTEVQDFVDRLGNRYVTIYVYPENVQGLGLITIVGKARVDYITEPGKQLEIPFEWQDKPNIKWYKWVNIEPLKLNKSNIVFDQTLEPEVTLTEVYKKFNQISYATSSTYSASLSGTFTYLYSNNQLNSAGNSTDFNTLYRPANNTREPYTAQNSVLLRKNSSELFVAQRYNPNDTNDYQTKGLDAPYGFSINYHESPVIISNTDVFLSKHIGAKVIVPDFVIADPSPFTFVSNADYEYSDRVGVVLDSKTISLATPYTRSVVGNNGYNEIYYPGSLNFSTLIISGSESPTYTESNAYKNIIHVEFKNMKPTVGNIFKVKTYAKSKSGISDYQLIGESIIQSEKLLVDRTKPEYGLNIGDITDQTSVTTYWSASQVNTSDVISLSYDNSNLIDSFCTVGTLNSGQWEINPILNPIQFYKADNYQLSMDIYGEISGSSTPSIKFYMSGSAFETKLNEDVYGKYIGGITLKQPEIAIRGLNIDFVPEKTGTGQLSFLIDGGKWCFANLQVSSLQEPGYSPSYFAIDIEVPLTWDAETTDFKFEFCNSDGVPSDDIVYIENVTFAKGKALYIQGNDNYMTGSMVVTGSIYMTGSFYLNGILFGATGSTSTTTLSATEIAYGSATNTVSSSVDLKWANQSIYITGSERLLGDAIISGRLINGSNVTAEGNSSHAEGILTQASGAYSHTEGSNTITVGIAAHAEGRITVASGNYSHAEGDTTKAYGQYSHAEGFNTVVYGTSAHAEGSSTAAPGNYSHAEGGGTIASGSFSHAEGAQTVALGNSSHAEGVVTTAGGYAAHSEGSYTYASGSFSHAEGDNTGATGSYSHVEGNRNVTVADYSHAEGFNNKTNAIYSHIAGTNNTLNTTATGSAIIAANNIIGTEPYTLYTNNIRSTGSVIITGSLVVSGSLTIGLSEIKYIKTEISSAQIVNTWSTPANYPVLIPGQGTNTIIIPEKFFTEYSYSLAPYTGSTGMVMYAWNSASWVALQQGLGGAPEFQLNNPTVDMTLQSQSFSFFAKEISTVSGWGSDYKNSPILLYPNTNYTHGSTGGSLTIHCFFRVLTV